MADADVFGIPGEDSSNDDWLKAGIGDDPSAPDQAAPPVTGPEPGPAVPAPGVPGQVEGPAVEAPLTEGQKLWANKFASPEELEKAYRSATGEMHRARTTQRQIETQFEELSERNRVLEETLQRALPFLQGMNRPQYPVQQQPGQPAYEPGLYDQPQPAPQQYGPEQFLPYVDQMVAQRTEAIREELRSQMAAEDAVADAEDTIGAFFEKHPEIEVYGEVDKAIVDTLGYLNSGWQQYQAQVDVTDVDQLERVYEASRREALLQVLEDNPRYIQSENGMTLARFEASLLEGAQPITQGTAQVPASMVGQRPPVVERAATGTAPEGAQPVDEFEEAVLQRRRALGTTFGGSVF